jgi:nickel/cobalt exporter
VTIETRRSGDHRQVFSFVQSDGFLESQQKSQEQHESLARLQISHGRHSHDYDFKYAEHDPFDYPQFLASSKPS